MSTADRDLTMEELHFLAQHSGLPTGVWRGRQSDVQAANRADLTVRANHADTLSVDEAAAQLGVDPELVSQWLARGEVAGWAFNQEARLPAWQFTDGGLLPHLAEVLAALPTDLHPATVRGFVTTPQDDLDGKTVVEWLIGGGDASSVAFAASALNSW